MEEQIFFWGRLKRNLNSPIYHLSFIIYHFSLFTFQLSNNYSPQFYSTAIDSSNYTIRKMLY